MYRCSNILSVVFKLHQRSARIAIVTLLTDTNLMQVRTWCRSALLSSQEDVNWQMYFLVTLHVVPCFQGVWQLWILSVVDLHENKTTLRGFLQR